MKKKSTIKSEETKYKITLYTPQGATNQTSGYFTKEQVEQLKENIGRDFVYTCDTASFNLKFYHAVTVEAEK